jgi:DNA-directed RNA polymerase subunit RPC12/RpoP
MNNACLQCGAVYNVQQKDVGRRIACKKCGARLIVEATGLQFEPAGAVAAPPMPIPYASPNDDDDLGTGSVATPVARPRRAGGGDLMGRFSSIDLATWLLGAGSFLVVVFLFRPLIDDALIASARAEIDNIRLKEMNSIRAFALIKEPKSSDIKAREEAAKAAKENEEAADRDAIKAQIDARQARTWNLRGMMLGFLLLAVASLGYMTPEQPTIRRTAGTIILCSLLVLVFIYFVFAARSFDRDESRSTVPPVMGVPKGG